MNCLLCKLHLRAGAYTTPHASRVSYATVGYASPTVKSSTHRQQSHSGDS